MDHKRSDVLKENPTDFLRDDLKDVLIDVLIDFLKDVQSRISMLNSSY